MQIATQPLAQSVRVQRKWQTLWKLSVPNFQWRAKIQKPGRFQNPKWNSESVKKFHKKHNSVCPFLIINRLLSNLIHFVQLLRNCCLAPSIHAAFVRHEAKEQWLDDAQTYAIDGTEGRHPTQVLAVFGCPSRDGWYICHLKKRKIINSNMANEIWDSWPGRVFVKSSSLLCQKHLPTGHNLTFGTVRGESTTNETGSPNDRSHEDQGRSG